MTLDKVLEVALNIPDKAVYLVQRQSFSHLFKKDQKFDLVDKAIVLFCFFRSL